MLQVSPGEVYVIVTTADDINSIAIGPALFDLNSRQSDHIGCD